jgi:hypothetical protein
MVAENRRHSEKPYIVTRDKHVLAKVVSLYARHFSGGEILNRVPHSQNATFVLLG